MRLFILSLMFLLTPYLIGEDAKLPPAAQALVDKADIDVARINAALAEKLSKVQDAATKKGDLDGAMAIKKKIETLMAGPTPVTLNFFVGEFEFAFSNGHSGHLSIHNEEAQVESYHGRVTKSDNGLTITWSNNSQWQLSVKGNDVIADAPDGHCKLTGHIK